MVLALVLLWGASTRSHRGSGSSTSRAACLRDESDDEGTRNANCTTSDSSSVSANNTAIAPARA